MLIALVELIHSCCIICSKATVEDDNHDEDENGEMPKPTYRLSDKLRLFFGVLSLLCTPAFWGNAAQSSIITEVGNVGERLVGGIFTMVSILIILICQHCELTRRRRLPEELQPSFNMMIIVFWVLYFICCAYSAQSVIRKYFHKNGDDSPLLVVFFVGAETAFSVCCLAVQFTFCCKKSEGTESAASDTNLNVPLLDPAANSQLEECIEDGDVKTFPQSPQVSAPINSLQDVRDCHRY